MLKFNMRISSWHVFLKIMMNYNDLGIEIR